LFRKTERVLVVNNDTEFREDTYERLWQHQVDSGRHFVTAVSVGTKEQLESGEVEPERRGERPHPDFSCFLIDKYCWTRVGPFDPHFRPAFREDQDYHWRMKQAGVEAVCIDLPFLHYASQTVKNNPKDAEKVAKWDGFRERYYKEKWGGMWPEEKFKEPFDSKRHECKICRIR
jgi:GT2 family glycosyltransferase